MQKLNFLLSIFIIPIVISCQYDPYAHKYTTSEPNDYELIGSYVFEKQTIDYDLIEFNDPVTKQLVIPKIKINPDGTYEVIHFPNFTTWNPTFSGLISAKGEWVKTTIGSIGGGSSDLKDHWGMHFKQLPKESQNVGLMNKEYPFKLIFGYGDPDEGNVMIFGKE